ncbi:MAG: phage terminase large subunit family protein [Puniceicoccaceae bacterium]
MISIASPEPVHFREHCVDTVREALRWSDREPVNHWAESVGYRLPASLRSSTFRPEMTPWLNRPLERLFADGVKRVTLLGPVQGAKSTLGEATIGYIRDKDPGNILYNWEDHGKAQQTWDERIDPLIRANRVFRPHYQDEKLKKLSIVWKDGFWFRMQGIKAVKSRQSSSVRYCINEEVKDWDPGALTDVIKRVTAAWNALVINISPASYWDKESGTGDELFMLYHEGTCEEWEVPCLKCGEYQWMEFDRDDKGNAGGMLWDSSDAVRLASGRFDWPKLASTIRWQCAHCGHEHEDTPSVRAALAHAGRYRQTNMGPVPGNLSYRYNALTVPWIPFIDLVKEHYAAVMDARVGRLQLLEDFCQKRKVVFFDRRDRPVENQIAMTGGVRKGQRLEGADFTLMDVDKQKDHFWVIIRDWKRLTDDPSQWLHTRLVFEGRVSSENDVEALREEFDVLPQLVWVDSGYRANEVYRMCARFGYTAIKGEDTNYYHHIITYRDGRQTKKRKTREIYSEPIDIDVYEGTADQGRVYCPLILYSKQSIRDRLAWVRSAPGIRYEIPEDVSEDYKLHNDAEVLRETQLPRTGQYVKVWVQMRRRNDLFVCEAYQVLQADVVGLLGGDLQITERPDGLTHKATINQRSET